ncbi:hypothetical protein [Winogradskyella sp. PE311]|uniref:hypothetical protein n=1 Tax=Winogradskyella sp. PE311 TaxID=3366943 RepID=UPI00397FE2C4
MEQGGFVIVVLILRIVGVMVCVNKAKELNRSTGGWGFFGFISPIIAMIWIHCMKPITVWDENTDVNKN